MTTSTWINYHAKIGANLLSTAKSFGPRKGNAAAYNKKGLSYMKQHTKGDEHYIGPEGVKKKPTGNKPIRIGSRSIVKYKQKAFESTSSHKELKEFTQVIYSGGTAGKLFLSKQNNLVSPDGNVWALDSPKNGTEGNCLTGGEIHIAHVRIRLQIQNMSMEHRNVIPEDPNLYPIFSDYRIIIFFDKAPPDHSQIEICNSSWKEGLLGDNEKHLTPAYYPTGANLFDINLNVRKRLKILYDETFVVGPSGVGQLKTHELDFHVKDVIMKVIPTFEGSNYRVVTENQLCIAIVPNYITRADNGVFVNGITTIKFYN